MNASRILETVAKYRMHCQPRGSHVKDLKNITLKTVKTKHKQQSMHLEKCCWNVVPSCLCTLSAGNGQSIHFLEAHRAAGLPSRVPATVTSIASSVVCVHGALPSLVQCCLLGGPEPGT